jgi:hypothetical protein
VRISNSIITYFITAYFIYLNTISGGSQKLENVCRQRFRILKIIQVEPYMIADVEYGFSGNFLILQYQFTSLNLTIAE